MEVTGGGNKTPQNAVMPCRIEVQPSEVLNMSGSLHLIFDYVLKDKHGGLEV